MRPLALTSPCMPFKVSYGEHADIEHGFSNCYQIRRARELKALHIRHLNRDDEIYVAVREDEWKKPILKLACSCFRLKVLKGSDSMPEGSSMFACAPSEMAKPVKTIIAIMPDQWHILVIIQVFYNNPIWSRRA